MAVAGKTTNHEAARVGRCDKVEDERDEMKPLKVDNHHKMEVLPTSHSDGLKLLRLPLKERQAIINVHIATAGAGATWTFSRSEQETLPHHRG